MVRAWRFNEHGPLIKRSLAVIDPGLTHQWRHRHRTRRRLHQLPWSKVLPCLHESRWLSFRTFADIKYTSSSAVAKRPRDASCLSVVSFNSTKRRVESFIVKLLALQHRRRSREGGSAGPDTHNNLVVRVLYGLDPHNNLATLQNL